MRPAFEYRMAYWYLRSYPQDHYLFMNPSGATPDFNTMLQRIEQITGSKDQVARDWIKGLHPFSHASGVRVSSIIDVQNRVTRYRLGPHVDEGRFRFCVSKAITLIVIHLEALDNFRRLIGGEALPALRAFATLAE